MAKAFLMLFFSIVLCLISEIIEPNCIYNMYIYKTMDLFDSSQGLMSFSKGECVCLFSDYSTWCTEAHTEKIYIYIYVQVKEAHGWWGMEERIERKVVIASKHVFILSDLKKKKLSVWEKKIKKKYNWKN